MKRKKYMINSLISMIWVLSYFFSELIWIPHRIFHLYRGSGEVSAGRSVGAVAVAVTAGGSFDTVGVLVFGVTGGFAVDLSEPLQLV